ncbi:hypothetical protein ALC62_03439, partial [Cyphomyrmex costatus]
RKIFKARPARVASVFKSAWKLPVGLSAPQGRSSTFFTGLIFLIFLESRRYAGTVRRKLQSSIGELSTGCSGYAIGREGRKEERERLQRSRLQFFHASLGEVGGGRQATVDMDVDDVDVEAPVVGGGRKEAEVRPTERSARERERERAGELKRVAENEREREIERERKGLVLSEGVSSG